MMLLWLLWLLLSLFRVATHEKVKNSLTFSWPLNSFHWPFKNETIHVYITFSLFCKPSILLSSVSISFCFLRDFERKAFDFTNKSILLLIFFSASVARALASLVSYWTHVCVQASSVKLIGFLALQHTFSLKMYWKIVQKTY